MSGRGLIPTAPAPRPTPVIGIDGLCVTGSRARCGGGWFVLVTVRGEDGAFTQTCLTTDQARDQARQLIEIADVLEGKVW